MKRTRPLSGISSQWEHDDDAFRFARSSGLNRYHFASDKPPFPWRPMLIVLLLIALGLWLTKGTTDDEVASLRLHQVQR